MADRVFLTKEQAITLIEDKEDIHTFRSAAFGLMWADWSRKDIIEEIERSWEESIEIWWTACIGMWHGLVIYTSPNHPLFVEANTELLQALEKLAGREDTLN